MLAGTSALSVHIAWDTPSRPGRTSTPAGASATVRVLCSRTRTTWEDSRMLVVYIRRIVAAVVLLCVCKREQFCCVTQPECHVRSWPTLRHPVASSASTNTITKVDGYREYRCYTKGQNSKGTVDCVELNRSVCDCVQSVCHVLAMVWHGHRLWQNRSTDSGPCIIGILGGDADDDDDDDDCEETFIRMCGKKKFWQTPAGVVIIVLLSLCGLSTLGTVYLRYVCAVCCVSLMPCC